MKPAVRRVVRWLFNGAWLTLLVGTPITCHAIGSPSHLDDYLILVLTVAFLVAFAAGVAGLFDPDRRTVSVLGLVVCMAIGGALALLVSLVAAAIGAAFAPGGIVVQLLDGLAHVR